MSMIHGLVAIIGRPNVGKSTLFNRMTSSDQAIVDDQPGVTRDRLYGTAWLNDEKTEGYMVIDTGGFETDDFKFQPFAENIVWQQTEAAIKEADLVMFVVDAKSGISPHDVQLKRYLEQLEKPHLVVVNKVDGPEQAQAMWDFFELGTDDLAKVSAAHNRGVSDLKELIADKLKEMPDLQVMKSHLHATRIAIVGRPNAGKSSILNRICGEERALVSEIAGTTRDAVDTAITYNGTDYVLVDTAGIRRKSKIDERLESLSVMRSIRAIERADVVLLIIDALQGMTEQDARLSSLAVERGKPLAVIVNKWDLFPDKQTNTAKEYEDAIHREVKTIGFAPVVFVSALENQRVHKLMALAERLAEQTRKRVETSRVNAALRALVQEHTPALIRGKTRRVKFYFATQVAIAPPTFVVFTNVAREIQESYMRYMTHRFRAELGFDEVPVRVILRPKSEVRKRDVSSAEEFEAKEKVAQRNTVLTEFDDIGDFDDDTVLIEVDADEEGGEFMVESKPCRPSLSPNI